MHRAAALLSVVCVMAPAFAGESLSMREYEERCASYYARQYGVSPDLVRAIIQIESACPHQRLNLRNFREHTRCALGGVLGAQTVVVLLDNISCCEKLLEGSLVQRGLRFRARGEGQEGTPLWNIVKQLCAIRRKQCNSSALLVRFKAFLGYSTYSLHPVISNADLNAVKLGVARSQVCVGNMPPAARDF